MKKTLKGSKGILFLVVFMLVLPFLFLEGPEKTARVVGFEWNCDQRPCHVDFTLENLAGQPIEATIEVRGYNFSSDLDMPRPRILVGKREFREHLEPRSQAHFQEEIKFTRYPDELEIHVLDTAPSTGHEPH